VFDFGLRGTEDEASSGRGVAGCAATDEADWEMAYTHNENKVEGKTISGYFSQTEYARIINNSNTYNPWSLSRTRRSRRSFPRGVQGVDADVQGQERRVRRQDFG
jgi:hypothetical protein